VDLVRSLKHAEARREKRLEAQHEKERRAELAREIANAKADQQRRIKHIDAAGIAAGVLGGSTANKEGGANGKALSREEASLMEAYVAELKSEIKQSHVPPDGVSSSLSADVEFLLAADGTMSHIRIVRSSGDRAFDRSVIEAFEHTRSIGPRPDGLTRTETMTFKMQEEDSQ
jgi:colicin import membrane protein